MTSEAVLTGAVGASGESLLAALREQMAASAVAVGPRKIAIAIADGAAKLEPFELQSDAGSTKVETTVDLASLVVDSQWVVQSKAPDIEQPDKPRKGALPPLTVVYVGQLKDAWSLEPRMTTDQLERELAIRRMELDADQLERLHKLDAERARQDEERRRALAGDQAARSAVMPPPVLPPGAPPPIFRPAPVAPGAPQTVLRPAPVPPAAPPANGAVRQQATPQQTQPGAPPQQSQQSAPPGVPAASAVPEAPQRQDSGAADVLDIPVPGQEAQVLPQGAAPATGQLPPGAAEAQAPQDASRARRFPRQVPAGEQVLRALQGPN
jgi:hypothetical protein